MSEINKELIENFRKIVLPFVSNRLYKTNFEGQGESDKTEFEHDFNEILDLAISALNPTGDLISRSALRERIRKKAATDVKSKLDIFTVEEILVTIGNVPPVQQSILPLSSEADNAYMRGYEVGKVDGILRANKRPHGKWVLVHPLQENDEGAYMCSVCRTGDWCISPEFKFCPYCGAAMDGGNAE